jgi:hypothetical protein
MHRVEVVVDVCQRSVEVIDRGRAVRHVERELRWSGSLAAVEQRAQLGVASFRARSGVGESVSPPSSVLACSMGRCLAIRCTIA